MRIPLELTGLDLISSIASIIRPQENYTVQTFILNAATLRWARQYRGTLPPCHRYGGSGVKHPCSSCWPRRNRGLPAKRSRKQACRKEVDIQASLAGAARRSKSSIKWHALLQNAVTHSMDGWFGKMKMHDCSGREDRAYNLVGGLITLEP